MKTGSIACFRKHRFDFRQDAERAARRTSLDAVQSGDLRAYLCEVCRYWHIGNTFKVGRGGSEIMGERG